jgi:hypothetical protein
MELLAHLSGQSYLRYLGFEPGAGDCVPSRTRAAIEERQQQQGLAAMRDFAPALLDLLRARVG